MFKGGWFVIFVVDDGVGNNDGFFFYWKLVVIVCVFWVVDFYGEVRLMMGRNLIVDC